MTRRSARNVGMVAAPLVTLMAILTSTVFVTKYGPLGVAGAVAKAQAQTGAQAQSQVPLVAGVDTILPRPHEATVQAWTAGIPSQVEVVTNSLSWENLGPALNDLLPYAADPAGLPLYRPAFSPAGERNPVYTAATIDDRGNLQVAPVAADGRASVTGVTTESPVVVTTVPVPSGVWEGAVQQLWQETVDGPVVPGRARLFLVRLGSTTTTGDPSTSPMPAATTAELASWSQRLTAVGLPALAGDFLAHGPEAYALSSGRLPNGQGVAVAAAASDRGLLYAALTWAQLLRTGHGIPTASVADWPAYPFRGVIEGFYGPPWSAADRLNQLAFYPWVRFNTYVYAPKDDPFHREKWRELYPPESLQQLRRLVELANRYEIDFVFAISPGLSVVFSSDQDFQALVAKTEQMRTIGVHHFALLLDDIPKDLKSTADRAKFKGDVATAQAFLINRYAAYLREKEPQAPLIVVPTDYYDLASTPYKRTLADQVAPDVIFYWTGVGVVAPVVTQVQAKQAVQVWKHSILMWDNYPVNDYSRNTLYLGPLEGRADVSGVRDSSQAFVGFTFNPMNEAEASKLPLATAADYAWNPAAYVPTESWPRALAQLVPAAAQSQFALFASAYLPSPLHSEDAWGDHLRSLLLQRLGDPQARAEADQLLANLQELAQLGPALANPALATEIAPWANTLALTGYLARSYYALLAAEQERETTGTTAAAVAAEWQSRADWLSLYAYWQLLPNRSGPLGEVVAAVADRVREPLDLISATGRQAASSMPAYQSHNVEQLADGRDDTFFWTARAPQARDWFGIDLGRVVPLSSVTVRMGSTTGPDARPNDYLRRGQVRISSDGSNWQTVGQLALKKEATFALPADTQARYVRVYALAAQQDWVQVRELSVAPEPTLYDLELSGGQLAAGSSGSSPAAQVIWESGSPVPALDLSARLVSVLDGNPATGVVIQPQADGAGARGALPAVLTVTRPSADQQSASPAEPARWGGLVLLLGPGSTGSLSIEITADGSNWQTLVTVPAGSLAAGQTAYVWRLPSPQPLAGYRLRWQPPSEPEPGASAKPSTSSPSATQTDPSSHGQLVVREFYPLAAEFANATVTVTPGQ